MKKLCTALFFFLVLTTANAQLGIGLRLGYSAAGFKEGVSDPKGGLTIGIPIEYAFNTHFALRADPSFYKYGSIVEDNQPAQLYGYKREIHYNTLRAPLSLLWRPLSNNYKFYFSLNAGIGYALYVGGVNDYTEYVTDVTTGDVTETNDRINFDLNDQSIFNRHEIFAVYGVDLGTHINENLRATFNFRIMQGLNDLNIDLTQNKDDPTYIGQTPLGLSASIILLKYF